VLLSHNRIERLNACLSIGCLS